MKDYLKYYDNYYTFQEQWWGDKNLNWEGALERAWMSRFPDGKMHSHQRRVSSKLGVGLRVSLADGLQPPLETFEQLYDWVESVTNRVKGLGAMTTYDVAQRLGMWLKLYPTIIYLHQGTSAGAEKFNVRGKTATLDAFPPEIQQLGAAHAENFLCIYKQHFISTSVV
ncbi:MAG: hypothetical protein SWX82_21675 [Cyanobacteriota bacterium]|nr:hypothetical protein [Cyanobacteriota bacterium]